jgi:hypothetical protein
MSLKDYSMLLKESLAVTAASTTAAAGNAGSGNVSDCVRVEHVLVLAVDPALARLAESLVEVARGAVRAGRVAARGVAALLALWGASRLLLAATEGRRRRRQQE